MSSEINRRNSLSVSSRSSEKDKTSSAPKEGKLGGHSVKVQKEKEDTVSQTMQGKNLFAQGDSGKKSLSNDGSKAKVVEKSREKSGKVSSVAKKMKITSLREGKKKLGDQKSEKGKTSSSTSKSRRSKKLKKQSSGDDIILDPQMKILDEVYKSLISAGLKISKNDMKDPIKIINSVYKLELKLLWKINILLITVSKKGSKKRVACLNEALKLIKDIKDINITLLRMPYHHVLKRANSEIREIAKTFHQAKVNIQLTKTPRELIEKCEKFIIISLIKLDFLKSGKSFIRSLKSIIYLKGHHIDVKCLYLGGVNSLRIGFSGNPRDGFLKRIQNLGGESASFIPIETLSKELFKTYVPGKGASSSLQFCVPLKEDTSPIEYADTLSRNPEELELVIGSMISGNFSFTKDLRLIYTPAFIEIAHELVHALHSSLGVNAGEVEASLLREDKDIWTSPEEYRAIEGIPSENFFAEEINLPKRFSHIGIQYPLVIEKGLVIIDDQIKDLKLKIKNLTKKREEKGMK